MKKTFSLVFLVFCATATIVLAMEKSFTNFYFGVKAKFIVRVVDENGKPVEGARVRGRFEMEHRGKFNVDEKLTNAAGEAEITGSCHSSMGLSVTKDGCYKTWRVVNFFKEGYDIQDGKWQPYGSVVQVMLKSMHKPIPMSVFQERYFRVPKTDQEYGFDMEYGALVEPFGPGKVADFYIKYTWNQENDIRSRTMTLSFPNCLDGAYPIDLDAESRLKSPYHADPDAEYVKTFVFKWQKDGYTVVCNECLAQNQGLVLRTRTKVDADGKLVSAHYGKIYGKIEVTFNYRPTELIDSNAHLFFNPVENDTNLEFDGLFHIELKKGTRLPEEFIDRL